VPSSGSPTATRVCQQSRWSQGPHQGRHTPATAAADPVRSLATGPQLTNTGRWEISATASSWARRRTPATGAARVATKLTPPTARASGSVSANGVATRGGRGNRSRWPASTPRRRCAGASDGWPRTRHPACQRPGSSRAFTTDIGDHSTISGKAAIQLEARPDPAADRVAEPAPPGQQRPATADSVAHLACQGPVGWPAPPSAWRCTPAPPLQASPRRSADRANRCRPVRLEAHRLVAPPGLSSPVRPAQPQLPTLWR